MVGFDYVQRLDILQIFISHLVRHTDLGPDPFVSEHEVLIDLVLTDMLSRIFRIPPLLAFGSFEMSFWERHGFTVLAFRHWVDLAGVGTFPAVGAVVSHLGGNDGVGGVLDWVEL